MQCNSEHQMVFSNKSKKQRRKNGGKQVTNVCKLHVACNQIDLVSLCIFFVTICTKICKEKKREFSCIANAIVGFTWSRHILLQCDSIYTKSINNTNISSSMSRAVAICLCVYVWVNELKLEFEIAMSFCAPHVCVNGIPKLRPNTDISMAKHGFILSNVHQDTKCDTQTHELRWSLGNSNNDNKKKTHEYSITVWLIQYAMKKTINIDIFPIHEFPFRMNVVLCVSVAWSTHANITALWSNRVARLAFVCCMQRYCHSADR